MTNLMERTSDGALKTTTKKGNGVNIRGMKVIISMILDIFFCCKYHVISRHFFLSNKNIHDISSLLKVEGDCIETENVLTLKDGTEIVSKEKFTKME